MFDITKINCSEEDEQNDEDVPYIEDSFTDHDSDDEDEPEEEIWI